MAAVAAWLMATVSDPVQLFGKAIRKSIDEVLDGPRTGRWSFDQLEKTEKTYVGTKLEIITRTELDLRSAGFMDLEIDGQPVDIKWSKSSVWQIPEEAVGQLCLCIGALKHMTSFQVGLLRCKAEYLNRGKNRDGKKTVSETGRAAMLRLVSSAPIPTNFVAEMDPRIRRDVMAEPTIQRRITRLFVSLPKTPIPRNAVRTIAQTEGDPMRRLRADRHAGDPLKGYKILSAKYGNQILRHLGYPPLAKDEFMSIPIADLDGIPTS